MSDHIKTLKQLAEWLGRTSPSNQKEVAAVRWAVSQLKKPVEDTTRPWRTMDTAPKDETDVLLHDPDLMDIYTNGVRIGSWYKPMGLQTEGEWGYNEDGTGVGTINPTRWQPLPLIPEESCPGHVASATDPKVCGRCGVHINELRLDDE